jgi:hypothetical protein
MTTHAVIPAYLGLDRLGGQLPLESERWPKFSAPEVVDASGDDYDLTLGELRRYAEGKPWVWPRHTVCFVCDVHADADAFVRSLVASGGVAVTGESRDFRLTEEGREFEFVIGGDCLDKGPANLPLLDSLSRLMETGARVELLAGNHDVRALLGLVYMGRVEPQLAHLFVRMGKKSLRLFREVWDGYLAGKIAKRTLLSDRQVRARFFPSESWFDEFPKVAAGRIPPKKLQKEINRIREKIEDFLTESEQYGMSLGMVHAAAEKCRELFVGRRGRYRWFFDRMNLAKREGSFLFVHAGVCDQTASILRTEGVEGLNRRFRAMMEGDLFDLYHGPLGNVFRTKYRDIDFPLTEAGVSDLHRSGIYAIVHGHQPVQRGQRMVLRAGLLNFECDASIDGSTRAIFGLRGEGAAVTMFRPVGKVVGLSTDYRYAKVLDATAINGVTTIVDTTEGEVVAAAN